MELSRGGCGGRRTGRSCVGRNSEAYWAGLVWKADDAVRMERNASQIARTPGAVRRKSFIRYCIKLAGARVPLDRGIELLCVVRFEPRTKPRQFTRGELFDGFFDVFDGGHSGNIAFE
jgi:hypothetical protein